MNASTQNNLKTFMLLAGLTAAVLLLGLGVGNSRGLIIAALFVVAMNVGSYWFSDKIALKMNRAKPVSQQEAPQLYSIVAHLAQRAGLPMPQLYITPDMQPNAFATGRDPKHAAVAVTQGILQILSPTELEGVLAHEMSHIKHRDILISSVTATLAGVLSFLPRVLWLFGGRDSSIGMVGRMAMWILAPIAAMMIQMMVSRSREFEADREGARLCGRPVALADALRRLESGAQNIPMQANQATAHMYIINPLRADGLKKLFSSHPPTAERVARLEAMANNPSLME
jgi:heat shock protein HtpX